jgi:hypothetical protein
MAKKHGKSKQRDDYVYGIVDARETGEIHVRYDSRTGKIELVGAEAGSTRVVRSYKRDTGKEDKVVSSVPHEPGAPFDPDDALKSFENVVAMDTNKRTIGGKQCAVCFSYFIPVKLNEHTGDIPYNPLAAYFIVGIEDGVNPERIGWHLTLMNNISPAYDPSRHGRLALVTDSELGLHSDINARKIGYYGDQLLPEWATLVYASDRETDTLGGMLLKACHNAATSVIEEMRKRANPFEKIGNGGVGFEGYSQVVFQTA